MASRKEFLRNERIAKQKKEKETVISPVDPFYAFAAFSFGIMTEDEARKDKLPNRPLPRIILKGE